MGKVLARPLIILFAITSSAGYLFVTGKMTAGERQIADGQRELEKGEHALDEVKARLQNRGKALGLGLTGVN